MRTWYDTDADVEPTDQTYVGAFSAPFPAESETRKIVHVDWSVRGSVEVTWLVSE